METCNGIMGLKKVEESSASNRENRCEEMHQLYRLIQSEDDIRALVHYRNYVVPGTILLDTQIYQKHTRLHRRFNTCAVCRRMH